MEKLILTVATTGNAATRDQNPNLAITPKEIASEIIECYHAGAAVAHIHVREDDGGKTMSFEKYKEVVERVRDKCDIIINFTSSGMTVTEEDRLKPLTLRPDLASFNAGSMNFGEGVFQNSFRFMRTLAKTMEENNVKPEIEVYDAGMIRNSLLLEKEGYLKGPLHYQFVLGVRGGMAATPENVVFLKNKLPADATWGAIGIGGRDNLPISTLSMIMGGHTRVGMEDNVYYRKGQLVEKNVQFVERIKRIAYEYEREIASVKDACKILKLRGE